MNISKLNSMAGRVTLAMLLAICFLTALVLAAVQAVEPQSRSFLAVQSLYLTNTANPTNLLTTGSVGTNFNGVTFTNANRLVVINTTSGRTNIDASKINPFQDVALWALTDGSPPWSLTPTNGALNYNQSFATLSITWTGGSGANTAIPFVFTPVYNGFDEATETAQEWSLSLTPSTTRSTISTNVPLYKWPGAAKLRLRRAVSSDTDASSQVIVEDISLNGYPP